MAASVKQGFRQFRPKMQGASVGLVMRRGETLCQYLFDGFDADRAGQRDEGAKDGDVVRNGRAEVPMKRAPERYTLEPGFHPAARMN